MTLTENYLKNHSRTSKNFIPEITFSKDSEHLGYSKVVKFLPWHRCLESRTKKKHIKKTKKATLYKEINIVLFPFVNLKF